MSHPAKFTLTIANGATTSPALSSLMSKGAQRSTFGNSSDMTIFAPATLTGTVTVQVSPRYGNLAQMVPLQKDGADVTLAAGRAVQIPIGAIEDLRLVSGAAEGAARDFTVVIQVTMGQ